MDLVGRERGREGRSRGRGQQNQDILCENSTFNKNSFFNKKEKCKKQIINDLNCFSTGEKDIVYRAFAQG